MVNLIPWAWLISDFMVASFARFIPFLRYISEFTRYASPVNKEIRDKSSIYTTYTFWVVIKHNSSDI